MGTTMGKEETDSVESADSYSGRGENSKNYNSSSLTKTSEEREPSPDEADDEKKEKNSIVSQNQHDKQPSRHKNTDEKGAERSDEKSQVETINELTPVGLNKTKTSTQSDPLVSTLPGSSSKETAVPMGKPETSPKSMHMDTKEDRHVDSSNPEDPSQPHVSVHPIEQTPCDTRVKPGDPTSRDETQGSSRTKGRAEASAEQLSREQVQQEPEGYALNEEQEEGNQHFLPKEMGARKPDTQQSTVYPPSKPAKPPMSSENVGTCNDRISTGDSPTLNMPAGATVPFTPETQEPPASEDEKDPSAMTANPENASSVPKRGVSATPSHGGKKPANVAVKDSDLSPTSETAAKSSTAAAKGMPKLDEKNATSPPPAVMQPAVHQRLFVTGDSAIREDKTILTSGARTSELAQPRTEEDKDYSRKMTSELPGSTGIPQPMAGAGGPPSKAASGKERSSFENLKPGTKSITDDSSPSERLLTTVDIALGNISIPSHAGVENVNNSAAEAPVASSTRAEFEKGKGGHACIAGDPTRAAARGPTNDGEDTTSTRMGSGVTHEETDDLDKKLPPQRNLLEIAEQTPVQVRSRHKEMLLGLFLQVDEQRLAELAKKCGESSQDLLPTTAKPKRVVPGEKSRSMLGILPVLLERFQDLSSQQQRGTSTIRVLEDTKKRKMYASRPLDRLKELVANKFTESEKYKKYRIPATAEDETNQQSHTKPDTTPTETIFTPFALEYNECSIAAIGAWVATQNESKDQKLPIRAASTSSYSRQTVAPMFRKCSVCSLYGHYEIECNELNEEDLLELARLTKNQTTVRELVEKKKVPKTVNFRYFQTETMQAEGGEETKKKLGSEDAVEELGGYDMSRAHLACEVCHSGLDDDHMLICDGCDRLFHLFCLEPPLHQVPEGDWFCEQCERSTHEVSSDIEIEACDGFVIEQRKRPRNDSYLGEEQGIGLPEDGWQTAVAVIGDETQAADEDTITTSGSRGKRRRAAEEEEVEIDGFKIKAKSTSKSPHVSRRMKAWRMNVEDIAKDPIVVSSVVAWFPPMTEASEEDNKVAAAGSSSGSTEPFVGIVLCIDAASRRALVRQVVEWKDILLDSWTERTTEAPERLEDCAIQAVASGATTWIAMSRLHLVGRAPPSGAIESFQSNVLPARLANERRNRISSAGVPQAAAILTQYSEAPR